MLWLYLALAYALFHSAVGILDRYVLRNKKIETMRFSMVRFIANSLIGLLLTVLFISFQLPSDPNFWFYVVGIGLLYGFSAMTYFLAVKQEQVSKIVPYGRSMTTFLSFLFAVVLLGEIATINDFLGTLAIVIGTYVILGDGKILKIEFVKSKAIVLMTIQAITLSIVGVVSKTATSFIDPFLLNLFTYFFAMIYFVFLNLAINYKNVIKTTRIILSDKIAVIPTIASSAFATVGTLFLLIALKIGNAAEVLPASGALPLFVVIFGWLGLQESHWKSRLIGAGLIVAGIYGLSV